MDDRLQLFTVWSQRYLKWPTQLIRVTEHVNGLNSVSFSDIEIKLSVIVAESDFFF